MAQIMTNSMEVLVALYQKRFSSIYEHYHKILEKILITDTWSKYLLQGRGQHKTLSKDGLHLLCRMQSFPEKLTEVLLSTYEKIENYNEGDQNLFYEAMKHFVLHGSIELEARDYGKHNDPAKFLANMAQMYKLTNSTDKINDSRFFSTSKYGDIDTKSIVKDYFGKTIESSMDIINKSSALGGYLRGQMFVIAGPPGCFLGEEKVLLSNGEMTTFKSLHEDRATDIPIYIINPENNKIDRGTAEYCALTKHVKELCEVSITGKVIRCTLDHPFLLDDGTYIEAKDLLPGYRLRSMNSRTLKEKVHKVENVEIKYLLEEVPVYGLVNADKFNNYAIVTNEELKQCVFVHNTGKSLKAMEETLHFIKQGLKVHYGAFGDLKYYDFKTRLSAMVVGAPISAVELDLEYWDELACKQLPNLKTNLTIELLSSGTFSIEQYVNRIMEEKDENGLTLHEQHDVFIIDYDTNLKSGLQMYEKGEEIYQTAYNLTVPDKLVLILAQPSKGVWANKEGIGLEALAESSRKQQIVDGVLTISHTPDSANPENNTGYLNLCKNRRGKLLKVPYFRDLNGRFHIIDEETLHFVNASEGVQTLIEDLDRYKTRFAGTLAYE